MNAMPEKHYIEPEHFFDVPDGPLGKISGHVHQVLKEDTSRSKTTGSVRPVMKKVLPSGNELSKSIHIYLTVDEQNINNYFNPHDPSPIYMRQLSHELINYLSASVIHAKIHSVIFYRLKCANQVNRQYAEPLMYAIRGHFAVKQKIREAEFEKFKRRSWVMLAISLMVVVLCHCISTFLLTSKYTITTGLNNGLDIFSWVILWRPIDKLLFQWNPYLKDISLLKKLATAESLILDYES
jgi:hypothetical protein